MAEVHAKVLEEDTSMRKDYLLGEANSVSTTGGRNSSNKSSNNSNIKEKIADRAKKEKQTKELRRGSKKRSRDKLGKGLSPPKEKKKILDEETAPVSDEYDVTQWERTRYYEKKTVCENTEKKKHSLNRSKNHNKETQRKSSIMPLIDMNKRNDDGPREGEMMIRKEELTGQLVLGEARQIEQIRGEHLLKKPKFQLILLLIESVLSAVNLTVWSTVGIANNQIGPVLLVFLNCFAVVVLVIVFLILEYLRIPVKIVGGEKGHKNNKTAAKYTITYRWRFILLAAHIGRAFLICACITIVAMDDDFDGGSITILSLQPIHLIIIGLQITMMIRSKRNE